MHTAIRETQEEIGLSLHPDACLGPLSDHLAIPFTDLLVRPFVFWVRAVDDLTLNHEVASVHRVRLAHLLSNEGRGSMQRTYEGAQYTLPRVDFDGVRLWGITLRMVDELLHRIDGFGTGLARIQGTN